MSGFQINLDDEVLAPLVARITKQVVEQLDETRAKFGGRLGYTLPEAAAMIGVKPHVLRDARARGEIRGRLIGKRLIFSRDELIRFVNAEEEDSR